MAKIYKQITDLIGKTPLVELGKYSASKGLETPVIAKVEFFNPGGSVKDRIALAMIEDAEQKGILNRANQWQHGCGTGIGICREGLSPHPHHAWNYECGAQKPGEGLRRRSEIDQR